MSAQQAAELLGVKRATLYTYVSRGLVRCVPEPGTKEKRYVRADLARLKVRHDARAGHAAVAAGALRWGEPVIDSAVSRVGAEGLAYRGHSAVRLAVEGRSLEDVAELLWTGSLPVSPMQWPPPSRPCPPPRWRRCFPGTPPRWRCCWRWSRCSARGTPCASRPPRSRSGCAPGACCGIWRPGWEEAVPRRGWAGHSRSGAWRTRWRWPGASRRSARPSC